MNEHQELSTKQCRDCKEELPISDFWKCTEKDDGLQTRCKECANKAIRETRKPVNLSKMTHKEATKAYKDLLAELRTKRNQITELNEQVRGLKGKVRELEANAGDSKRGGNGDAHIAPDCGDCEFYRLATAINRAINRPQAATKGHQYVIRPDGTVDLKRDTRN